ncbi:EamA family transporter [Nocardioides marmorisolisilvae]|uniref:DMT family transporter n=1 Tax=Nocardioides marmorisolisilvae TaxID=1542737 RepID=A0A3N0DVI4_9ACTN|nr:EamA family transporter [Nocardioides marmorisolisilvae]RNL79630.1 DMT family transporter [Nocardioides marmorisolisilvae]
MTVALALVAAFFYGLSDFLGGVFSRRTSVWPVGLLACVGATFGSVVIATFTSGDPTGHDFAWALLAGVGSGSGTAFLYRGLASGRMGVVAPVSAVGAVVVPLVAGVATGERPPIASWIGIALALPGIWLVSREDDAAPSGSSGLLDGIFAGLGFGLLFAALGQVPTEEAGYWPLVATNTVSVLSLVVVALAVGGSLVPRNRVDLGGLLAGGLASLAVLFFALANSHGLLSIAAVITSLYPAFTVIFAVGLLREHVHRAQAVGLAFCAASVVLVSLP